MERLIIEVPDQKSSLVKQLLTELGVTIQSENAVDKSTFKQNLLKVSVWTDEDVKDFEKNIKTLKNWKPEEW